MSRWVCTFELGCIQSKKDFSFSVDSTRSSGQLRHAAAPPAHRQQCMKQCNQLEALQKRPTVLRGPVGVQLYLKETINGSSTSWKGQSAILVPGTRRLSREATCQCQTTPGELCSSGQLTDFLTFLCHNNDMMSAWRGTRATHPTFRNLLKRPSCTTAFLIVKVTYCLGKRFPCLPRRPCMTPVKATVIEPTPVYTSFNKVWANCQTSTALPSSML